MITQIQHIIDRAKGKVPKGKRRNKNWHKLRNKVVKENPFCAACGNTKGLEAHHIKDFSNNPELELVESNLIVLCDKGSKFGFGSCHHKIGHKRDWRLINNNLRNNINYLKRMFKK